jgi:hypothetical protein
MSTRKIKVLLFWALIPLLAIGAFFLMQFYEIPSHKNKIRTYDVLRLGTASVSLIKVGNEKITEKMLNYQMAVQQAYQDQNANNQSYEMESRKIGAVVELMRFILEKEVAENNGVKVAKKEIKAFSKYADEYTKAPEILEKVKQVFGDDRKSYEKLYLVPKINSKKLHSFYSRNAKIHKEEKIKIERAYGLAVNGEDFKKIAEQTGGRADEFEIIEQAEDPLLSIVKTLSLNQIYSNIAENDQLFMVIKLIGQNEDSYKIAAIVIDKKPFDDWFKKEAGKIEIKFLDETFKSLICAEYGQVWWLTKACE